MAIVLLAISEIQVRKIFHPRIAVATFLGKKFQLFHFKRYSSISLFMYIIVVPVKNLNNNDTFENLKF